ncbi:MAG: long-chain fatty acid--CoA ligase [Acidobacteria bacterium]|nr:MAG: long-chain fatty acid--CoA ligase [Acidobacteriota bacterium]
MDYLPEVFDRVAASRAASIALIEENKGWTFAELADEANRIASVLKERLNGDTVGILLLNSQKYIATMLGAWKAGKTAVPLNYLLPPAELGFIIKDSGMCGLISSPFFNQALGSVKPLLGDRGVILMADDPGFTRPSTGGLPRDYRDPALFLYTSGTTGRPKGVILTHDNLLANVESCQRAGDFDNRDAFLCLLPFFHTYAITGTFLLPLTNGSKMVLVDRFQPTKVLGLIQEHKITVFLAIPSMYRVLAGTEGTFDLSSVRFPISGGEPLPPAVAEAFEKRFGVPIFEGYGQTEAAPVVTLNRPGARKPGTIGPPVPGVEVAIWDEQSRVLAAGEVGEIMVRGRNVMRGYHHLPEETAKTITDGWLHTGDLGTIDHDGFVSITGRKKDLIISAGENIYPREIEEILAQHPKVKEVAVIGVKDEIRGEVPKAFVIVRDGMSVEEKELRSFCRSNLANYKVPKYIELVADLPRTPTGKVLKRMLSAAATGY